MLLGHSAIEPGQTGHDAGRQLLQTLYRQHTGQEMPQIAVSHRGKPYFPNNPCHFSISHTKRHVFCAVSDRPIGIDAEELNREINLRLAEKILSPLEKEQYESAADPRLALLTFWVLKEAQAKCTGQGLQGYPNHTNFSLTDPRVQTTEGCLVAIIEEDSHVI